MPVEPKRNDIKVGDIVECIALSVSCDREREEYALGKKKEPLVIGHQYEVMGISYGCNTNWVNVVGNGVSVNGTYMNQFKKLNNSLNLKPMSSIISTIKKLARKEPEKTFIEVGFMDDAENITEDGKQALLHILWEEKQTELKALADKIKKYEDNKK